MSRAATIRLARLTTAATVAIVTMRHAMEARDSNGCAITAATTVAARLGNMASTSSARSPPSIPSIRPTSRDPAMPAAATATTISAVRTSFTRTPLVASWVEPVADAPHGDEMSGGRRVALDLLAQTADVDSDGIRAPLVGEVPELLEEIPAAEHVSWVAREQME